MKRGIWSAFVFAAGAWGGPAQEEAPDRVGKDRPPVVARKSLQEAQKRKNCAILVIQQMGIGGNQPPLEGNFEGVLRKDFAAVKGTAEIYARGATYLVNLGGRFDPPEELTGLEGLQAQSFRNPALLLKEVERLLASATFGGDEKVDGRECRIVDFVADETLVKQHLRELEARLNREWRRQGGLLAEFINLTHALDARQSVATYRMSVGKADLLPYRLEYVLRPKFRPGAIPGPERPPNLDSRIDVRFSRWDEDAPFDVPALIREKWGIR
jgi:hypothetical protein